MKDSIETIWKEGFLNEKHLVIPKINDLYNQKSMHLVDKIKRMFKTNLIAIVFMAVITPVVYSLFNALWYGIAASVLMLITAGYVYRHWQGFKSLDQGTTSLEYLKSFNSWLKKELSISSRIIRFSYPLYFLIGIGMIWSVWRDQEGAVMRMKEQFPDITFIGDIPLPGLIIVGVIVLAMSLFSGRIYRWDVRLVYGRVFDKLEGTIAEMERLVN